MGNSSIPAATAKSVNEWLTDNPELKQMKPASSDNGEQATTIFTPADFEKLPSNVPVEKAWARWSKQWGTLSSEGIGNGPSRITATAREEQPSIGYTKKLVYELSQGTQTYVVGTCSESTVGGYIQADFKRDPSSFNYKSTTLNNAHCPDSDPATNQETDKIYKNKLTSLRQSIAKKDDLIATRAKSRDFHQDLVNQITADLDKFDGTLPKTLAALVVSSPKVIGEYLELYRRGDDLYKQYEWSNDFSVSSFNDPRFSAIDDKIARMKPSLEGKINSSFDPAAAKTLQNEIKLLPKINSLSQEAFNKAIGNMTADIQARLDHWDVLKNMHESEKQYPEIRAIQPFIESLLCCDISVSKDFTRNETEVSQAITDFERASTKTPQYKHGAYKPLDRAGANRVKAIFQASVDDANKHIKQIQQQRAPLQAQVDEIEAFLKEMK